MAHLSYLGVLAFCVLGTAWLEAFLGTRVYARPRRLVLSLLPTVVVFLLWDVYAIDRGHWDFDADRMTGIVLPGGVPLEELLFFLVVPTCAILTLEAVRSRRPHWRFGDEAPDGTVRDRAGEGRRGGGAS